MKKLDECRIAFIGAGKVGFSLGRFFADNGIHVTGYYSRHVESARQAAEFTNSTFYEDLKSLVAENDVIFLTVPDGEIKSVYCRITEFDIKNKHICHCSGSMTARDLFPDIKQFGAEGYSIHPLFPVSDKLTSYRELSDAFFCLEGDDGSIRMYHRFFEERCKGVRIIDGKNKTKYHAACAIASNLYCGLMKLSLDLLRECDFDEDEARAALSPLVRSNLEHILSDGPVNSLTGPVDRGDIGTVMRHLDCFDNDCDSTLYLAATMKTLEVAKAKNPDRDYSEFDKLKERY